jgi:hypothetical protein
MLIVNRIHLGQVVLARSLAASFTTRQSVPARLPRRPIGRGPSAGGGRLLRLVQRFRIRSLVDHRDSQIHAKTKYRRHPSRLVETYHESSRSV